MGFLVFTYIGIAAALIQVLLPVHHRLGPASAIAVGVLGSWGGALLASTVVRGGWTFFGLRAFVGSVAGSALAIAAFELAAEAYKRSEAR